MSDVIMPDLEKLSKNLLPETLVFLEYTNTRSSAKIKCTECGHEDKIIPKNITKKTKCKNCKKKAIENKLENTFIRVKKFSSFNKDATVECKECDNSWDIPGRNINPNTKCPECSSEKIINEYNIKYPIIIMLNYYGVDKEADLKCKMCDNVFKLRPRYITEEIKCPTCKLEYVMKKYENDYIRMVNYVGSMVNADVECKSCDHRFRIVPNAIDKDKTRCPKCVKDQILNLFMEEELIAPASSIKWNWNSTEILNFSCLYCKSNVYKSILSIQRGYACSPRCRGNYDRAKILAKKHELKVVQLFDQNEIPCPTLIWTCKQGHKIETTLGEVKNLFRIRGNEKWCEVCNNPAACTEKYLYEHAAEHEGMYMDGVDYEGPNCHYKFTCMVKDHPPFYVRGTDILGTLWDESSRLYIYCWCPQQECRRNNGPSAILERCRKRADERKCIEECKHPEITKTSEKKLTKRPVFKVMETASIPLIKNDQISSSSQSSSSEGQTSTSGDQPDFYGKTPEEYVEDRCFDDELEVLHDKVEFGILKEDSQEYKKELKKIEKKFGVVASSVPSWEKDWNDVTNDDIIGAEMHLNYNPPEEQVHNKTFIKKGKLKFKVYE